MVSSMPNNKILFIVEGANDEVSFVKRLLEKYGGTQEYEIYPYKCTIHALAQILYDEYPDFDENEIDIQLVLKSKEQDKNQRELLSQKYRDVFLVFDFEPQHDHPHYDTVRRMLLFFNDSSDHGKLYINYPMMQSYKHFSSLPDDSFAERRVTIQDCFHYKQIVGRVSGYTDINQYNHITFVSLMVHHIKKANFILSGQYVLPTPDEYTRWNLTDIYDIQCSLLDSGEPIHVINTCILIPVDFAPKRFFELVSRRETTYEI